VALTKIGTDGVKDDAVTSDKVANSINSAIAANTAKTSLEDESVTLAKLEHGTSSNDGKFLRANNGADPTFETVNTDLVSDTSPQLGGNLDTNDHHILLDDNHYVYFGDNEDLKISHDGTDDVIHSTGNSLRTRSNIFRANNAANTAVMFRATAGGNFEAYHSGSKKLETTSDGATVTGTVKQTVLPSWSLRPNTNTTQQGFPHSQKGHTIGWSANTSNSSAKACHLSGGCTLSGFSGSPVGNGFQLSSAGSTGRLNVPLAGKYLVYSTVSILHTTNADDMKMFVNGTLVATERITRWQVRANEQHSIGPLVLDLAASDYIEIVIEVDLPNYSFNGYNDTKTWFTGHYIG